MRIEAIFIDDGGVMNDNSVRGPQWQALIGEFMAPRLGGTAAGWAEANRVTAPLTWQKSLQRMKEGLDFPSWWRLDQDEWLTAMCAYVGVEPPAAADERLRLAEEAAEYVLPRIRSAIPGAIQAVRELHAMGFRLFTATGEVCNEIGNYLDGMGIRHLFERLYGPDLVNKHKVSVEYHRAIFADAGVDPLNVLVVDDNAGPVAWAREAGARAIRVSADGGNAAGGPGIKYLAELPKLLAAGEIDFS